MKTASLTIDGSPVVSEYRERRIRRRKADIEIYEARRAHQMTANALEAAIQMIESGERSVELVNALKEVARRAESVTQ